MIWGKLGAFFAVVVLSEVCRIFIGDYSDYLVGSGSSFMYDKNPVLTRCVRWGCVGVCTLLTEWSAILNPLLVVSLAMESNDIVFTATLTVFERIHPTFGYLVGALLKHIIIEPQPSISPLWFLDTHFYTDFRIAARISVFLLEIVAIFLSRHFDRKMTIGFLIFCLFDPCMDWSMLALLSSRILQLVNADKLANAGILVTITGFVFNRAAFYSWWILRTGNANFAMIGSLLYSVGLITLICHNATRPLKKKCD